MAIYLCTRCGQKEDTGWTYYWTYLAMGIPVLCARCDPNQRCHFHAQADDTQKREE